MPSDLTPIWTRTRLPAHVRYVLDLQRRFSMVLTGLLAPCDVMTAVSMTVLLFAYGRMVCSLTPFTAAPALRSGSRQAGAFPG